MLHFLSARAHLLLLIWQVSKAAWAVKKRSARRISPRVLARKFAVHVSHALLKKPKHTQTEFDNVSLNFSISKVLSITSDLVSFFCKYLEVLHLILH